MSQSSASQPPVGHSPPSYSSWLVRGALAALILFGSQVLFWMEPERQSPLEWLLIAIGCLALSAALLDFAVRWRIYDLFGLLLVAGICALCSGLLFAPRITLADAPRTLVTRVVGLEALAGLATLSLAGALTARTPKRLLLAAAVLPAGLIWGLWAHWTPLSNDPQPVEVGLGTVLVVGGLSLALAGLLAYVVSRRAGRVTSDDLRLSHTGWAITLAVGLAILAVRLAQNQIDTISLVSMPTLVAFCIVMLRFQRRARGETMLESRLPLSPIKAITILLPTALFLAAGAIGYFLPRGTDPNNAIALIGAAFTGFGLVWLPMVSLVLGARAFIHEIQTMRL